MSLNASDDGMVAALISIRRLCALFLSLSIVLSAGVLHPAAAALLKDIRIGEYDRFTRIVFESDVALKTRQMASPTPGRLTVVFPDARAGFIRKIPVDRGHFLQDIQVHTLEDRLSIALDFDRPFARWDSFELDGPPRLALNVYWDIPAAGAGSADPQPHPAPYPAEDGTAHDAPRLVAESIESQLPGIFGQEPMPPLSGADQRPAVVDANGPSPDQQRHEIDAIVEPPTPSHPQNLEAQAAEPPQPASLPTATTSEPEPGDATGPSEGSRLQYYLVMALVVITIGILFLLIWMLVTYFIRGRNRRPERTPPPKLNEFLQHQDERIASINARVQEQLKRYNEV